MAKLLVERGSAQSESEAAFFFFFFFSVDKPSLSFFCSGHSMLSNQNMSSHT